MASVMMTLVCSPNVPATLFHGSMYRVPAGDTCLASGRCPRIGAAPWSKFALQRQPSVRQAALEQLPTPIDRLLQSMRVRLSDSEQWSSPVKPPRSQNYVKPHDARTRVHVANASPFGPAILVTQDPNRTSVGSKFRNAAGLLLLR